MNLKLWFGPWLVISLGLISAQILSDSFRRFPRQISDGGAADPHKLDKGKPSTRKDHPVLENSLLDSHRDVADPTNYIPTGPNLFVKEVGDREDLSQQEEEVRDRGGSGVSDEGVKRRSSRAALEIEVQRESSSPAKASAKQFKSGDEEDGSEVIGAFASLPPPTEDRAKSRQGGHRMSERKDQRLGNQFENRFKDRFEDRFEDRFKDRFKDRFEDRFEDRFKDPFKDQLEDRFKNRFEDPFKDQFEDRFKDRFEDRFKDRIEDRLKDRFEDRLNGRFEDRFKDRFEDRLNGRFEDRLKDRFEDRLNGRFEDRLKDRFEDRIPQWIPPIMGESNLGSRGSRFFPAGTRRGPSFDDPPKIIHRFNQNTDLTGFDYQSSGSRIGRKRNPVVEHSIFVNADPDDMPKRRIPSPSRGEGPIIIQRGDHGGRPILLDLDDGTRVELREEGSRPLSSKFGPVFTTIHGSRGNPDIVIPRPFDEHGPSVPDSSFAFSRNFGLRHFPRRERPPIPPLPPPDFQPPPVIQIAPPPSQSLNQLPSFKRPPKKSSEAPKISFFPDLGVHVDKPSQIQPEVTSSLSTIRSDVHGTSHQDSTSRGDHKLSRHNQHIPSSLQFSDRNWQPSFTQGFHALPPSSHLDRRYDHQNRLFPVDKVEPKRPYSFGYSVNDPSTGDHKAAFEERGADGSVRGQYAFLQPDGLFRRVTYVADDINGFRADVNYIPT